MEAAGLPFLRLKPADFILSKKSLVEYYHRKIILDGKFCVVQQNSDEI